MTATKPCRYCKAEIPADASVCQHCRRKQPGRLSWLWPILFAVGIVAALVKCGSGWAEQADDMTNARVDGSGNTASRIDLTNAYAENSAARMCGDRYPGNEVMQQACGRNAERGLADFLEIRASYLADPGMMLALTDCYDRHTQRGFTDFHMAGACARISERSLTD